MHIVQKLSLSAKSFESRKKLPAKALICLRKSSRESCAKKVMHFSDKSIVTAHLFGSRFGIVVVARDTIWKKRKFPTNSALLQAYFFQVSISVFERPNLHINNCETQPVIENI